ncbi:MAG TPA: hypothetical protein VJU61_25450, partial [Polyangiaceae bacterium]|nr:hypothetical protein [Polyangiaceae bacterium]
MNRGGRVAFGVATLLGVAWACASETRAPGGPDTDIGSGGTTAGTGGTDGTSDAGAVSDLDAGSSGSEGLDATVPGATTEAKFCGFDGERFTTYRLPSGESLGSFKIEPLRTFARALGVDNARGEVFVQTCFGTPPPGGGLATEGKLCTLDAFSVDAVDWAPPLHSIQLPVNHVVYDVIVDPSNDTLIALIYESDADVWRVVTVARDAIDLSAPLRQFAVINQFREMALDVERGELYLLGAYQSAVYARDASAAPLRSIPSGDLLVSPARGEYHVRLGFEPLAFATYALPAPAAPDAVPLRTLTLPATTYAFGEQRVDDVNGELWVGGSVFDLTASGEAVALGAQPAGLLVGALTGRDEVVMSSADIAYYSRTAEPGAPLRVLEADGYDPTQHLLAIDVQREEVFFISENGTVSTYAAHATGDAAPIRLLSTEYEPDRALLDTASNELLGALATGQWITYPAFATGRPPPTRRFTPQSDQASVDFEAVASERGQLLGIVREWPESRYVAHALAGQTAEARVVSRYGPALHDLDNLGFR